MTKQVFAASQFNLLINSLSLSLSLSIYIYIYIYIYCVCVFESINALSVDAFPSSHGHMLFISVTSIGIPLKTLLRTPLYCDGSTVVFLTPAPGGSTSNAARSLFGSGPSLGSLRC